MKLIYLFIPAVLLAISCIQNSFDKKSSVDNELIYPNEFLATDFTHPVKKKSNVAFYNAQKFRANNHLGEDWNAVTGGNTDLGEPIYSIANGYVKFARDVKGGWGNVIRINHKLPSGKMVESLYAHCNSIFVSENSWVKQGEKIGSIGTAHGKYFAHLHLEMRSNVDLPLGRG